MFDFRISGIVAGIAFLLSFLIGLLSKSTMPALIVRPLIFAVLFFILPALIKILVSRFLPELLEDSSPEIIPGSRVNITEGDEAGYPMEYPAGYPMEAPPSLGQAPVFAGAKPDDSGDDVGNISDLFKSQSQDKGFSAGMDQIAEDDYTEKGMGDFGTGKEKGAWTQTERKAPAETSFGFSDSEESLPDLDSMAGAFISSSSDENPETVEYSASTPARKQSSNKAQAWTGDFNAKEIAAGLRTVLNKDKEG